MHNESNVFSSSAKHLGIIIGDDFTWSTHIEHISIRLSKVNLLLMTIIIVFLIFTLGLSTALFSDNNQTWTNIIKMGKQL